MLPFTPSGKVTVTVVDVDGASALAQTPPHIVGSLRILKCVTSELAYAKARKSSGAPFDSVVRRYP
jgi:hypothetical protein